MAARRTPAAPKFRRLGADARRQSLIRAALTCLARYGPHGAGVREICAQADVSAGLLRHYFRSKDELIVEAFRTLTREFRRDLRSALKDPGLSAQARIEALFDMYLSSQLNDEARASTYLAVWALARTDPTLRRAQRAAYRELRRLIRPALAELIQARRATLDEQQAVIGLIALLDGLWLERYLDRKAFSRAKARAIAWRWLDALLGSSRLRRG